MPIKDILVHLDGETAQGASARRQRYALALASRFDAHLTAMILALQPQMPPMIMGEVPGTLLESERKASVEAAQAARDGFVTAAEAAGVAYEPRLMECPEGTAAGTLAAHARTADLVVVGQAEPDDALAIREILVEAALFDSGRPVLVVPHVIDKEPKFERVIVAWDGQREAARAAHDALALISDAGEVEVVVVGDAAAAVGKTAGADLSLNLARHGLNVTAKTINARGVAVADALLSHAADYGADLLVMGGYGHSRLRQFVLGGATRGILSSMTVPVLMAH